MVLGEERSRRFERKLLSWRIARNLELICAESHNTNSIRHSEQSHRTQPQILKKSEIRQKVSQPKQTGTHRQPRRERACASDDVCVVRSLRLQQELTRRIAEKRKEPQERQRQSRRKRKRDS